MDRMEDSIQRPIEFSELSWVAPLRFDARSPNYLGLPAGTGTTRQRGTPAII